MCRALRFFAARINPYYYDVIIGIGINIILAASLNLVNGYTGQFSLGHAGFMAVGAYCVGLAHAEPSVIASALGTFATTSAYFLALVAGGLIARRSPVLPSAFPRCA